MIKRATVRGDIFHKPVTLTGLVANSSCATQISGRFSEKLGLTAFVDIALTGLKRDVLIVWKMSTTPMIVNNDAEKFRKHYLMVP